MKGPCDYASCASRELRATPKDHVIVALDSVGLGDCGEVALENASAAVWMTKREDADALATLGLVYAARGEVGRAHALELEALSQRADGLPGSIDWLVVEKIAEALGITDEAVKANSKPAAARSGRGALGSPEMLGTVRTAQLGTTHNDAK